MYSEFTVNSDGVDLYCRRSGKGFPLLLIHGACVDCEFWRETAEYLSRYFSVITYDRRGYSRSTKPVNNDYSIHAQANDAASIIKSIGQPVRLIAHSRGAIIALELMICFPDLIEQAILYEPPVCECLPQDSEMFTALRLISDLIAEGKFTRALNQFWWLMGVQDERARQRLPEEMDDLIQNSKVFIHNEFSDTFYYHPKTELLRTSSLFIATGDLSIRAYGKVIAEAFSSKISCELVYYPGMHNCAYDLPASFAYMSTGILMLNTPEY